MRDSEESEGRERARASCSVGLKKLFCVYGVLPCSFCGSRSQHICRKANLNCTDLCSCFDVDDMSENKLEEDEYDDDSEDLNYESDDSDSDS